DIAPKNGDSAGFAVWIVVGTDRRRVFILSVCDILADGFAGGCDQGFVDVAALDQLVLNGRHAARLKQILNVGGACGSQVAEIWNLCAHLVKQLQIHRHSRLVGDGQQMENAVGGAAQSHVAGEGVSDRLFIDDVPGFNILFNQVHDSHSRVLCKLDTAAVNG